MAEHVAYTGYENAYKVLVWKTEGKRKYVWTGVHWLGIESSGASL